jgi:hypothetical protein
MDTGNELLEKSMCSKESSLRRPLGSSNNYSNGETV